MILSLLLYKGGYKTPATMVILNDFQKHSYKQLSKILTNKKAQCYKMQSFV